MIELLSVGQDGKRSWTHRAKETVREKKELQQVVEVLMLLLVGIQGLEMSCSKINFN